MKIANWISTLNIEEGKWGVYVSPGTVIMQFKVYYLGLIMGCETGLIPSGRKFFNQWQTLALNGLLCPEKIYN